MDTKYSKEGKLRKAFTFLIAQHHDIDKNGEDTIEVGLFPVNCLLMVWALASLRLQNCLLYP